VAHTVSARKRIRQSEKRRIRNKSNKSVMKTSVKKAEQAIKTGDSNVETLFREAVSTIYKTIRKGKIHRNNIARKISKLTLRFNAANKAKVAGTTVTK